MDKRMGCDLHRIGQATFNWSRPLPAYARAHCRFHPIPAKLVDRACRIPNRAFCMRGSNRRIVFLAGVALFILVWATAIGPEPPARIAVSPNELVRAVYLHPDSLIDLCLMDRVDPNGRDAEGRTSLLIATSQQDWKTVRRLIDAGAIVDLPDKSGFTPLMAAAAHGNIDIFGLLLARTTNLHAEGRTNDGRDLLGMALDGGNPGIVWRCCHQIRVAATWKKTGPLRW